MLIVQVNVKVKPEFIDKFKEATVANATESVKEAGIARFNFLQSQDDPAHFVLIESYRSPDAPAKHKETPHYNTWRNAVEPMMAEPRKSIKFSNLFPPDAGW
jgi:(4S)-4-hydroxy-5-phosphonooxypentane-2,3-dione isomerase